MMQNQGWSRLAVPCTQESFGQPEQLMPQELNSRLSQLSHRRYLSPFEEQHFAIPLLA
jgi:hypothetical protein